MDCFSASAEECFAALYREDGQEWSQAVNELYDGDVPGMDALFIEEIQLEPKYRGQGIGADIVRELISTFASTGIALVACKPFPLQYSDWKADDAEHRKLRETPGFEEKRIADFARVAQFWTELGFLKLKDCDVHTYAPHLRVRPEIPRVPRGRRRLQNKSVAPRRKCLGAKHERQQFQHRSSSLLKAREQVSFQFTPLNPVTVFADTVACDRATWAWLGEAIAAFD